MNRYATPFSACSSASRLRIAACTDTSRADVGSSHTTTFGSPANARAIATRCLSPPESCDGFWRISRTSKRTEWARSRRRDSICVALRPHQHGQRAGDDAVDREAAVERRVGVLEDDLHRADLLAVALADAAGERGAVELDHRALVGLGEPEQQARERGLAAARLAHEPERLAGAEREREVLDRAHLVAVLVERLADVARVQDRRHVAVGPLGLERRGRLGARDRLGLLVEVAAAAGARRRSRTGRGSFSRQMSWASPQRSAYTQPCSSAPRPGRKPGMVSRRPLALRRAAARDAAQQADRVRDGAGC